LLITRAALLGGAHGFQAVEGSVPGTAHARLIAVEEAHGTVFGGGLEGDGNAASVRHENDGLRIFFFWGLILKVGIL
jgi:hypothetical protein